MQILQYMSIGSWPFQALLEKKRNRYLHLIPKNFGQADASEDDEVEKLENDKREIEWALR